jgi:hypothetical protein
MSPSPSVNGVPLTAAEEAAQVAELYTDELVVGDRWDAVDSKWIREWEAYTGYDLRQGKQSTPTSSKRPSAIDNTSLQNPRYLNLPLLKDCLQEGIDFILVHSKIAKLIYEWYTCTLQFPRKVVAVGKSREKQVDVYPVTFCVLNAKEGPVAKEGGERMYQHRLSSFADICRELTEDSVDALGTKSFALFSSPDSIRFWVENSPIPEESKSNYAPQLDGMLSEPDHEEMKIDTTMELSSSSSSPSFTIPIENTVSHESTNGIVAVNGSSTKWRCLNAEEMKLPLETFEFDPCSFVLLDHLDDSNKWQRSDQSSCLFKIGDEIDVRDSLKRWNLATIRDIKTIEGVEQIKVQFKPPTFHTDEVRFTLYPFPSIFTHCVCVCVESIAVDAKTGCKHCICLGLIQTS